MTKIEVTLYYILAKVLPHNYQIQIDLILPLNLFCHDNRPVHLIVKNRRNL